MTEYFTLKLIKGAETLENIKIEKQGFELTKLIGAKGKHAMQTCKVMVRSKDVIDFLLLAPDYVFAEVYNGNECIFEGVIRPYVTIHANVSTAESISLEIMDYTEILSKMVFNDISKFGATLPEGAIVARCWKNSAVKVILQDLFSICGIDKLVSIIFEKAPGLDIVFDDFRIVEGDDLHDVIDTLCYEALIDYRFDVGKVTVFDTESNTPLLDITDYRKSVKVSRSKESDDGIKLTYQNVKTERCELFHENNSSDGRDIFNPSSFIQPQRSGVYFNRKLHDDEAAPTVYTVSWSFDNLRNKAQNAIIVDVTNAVATANTLTSDYGVSWQPVVDSYDETGGCVYVNYSGIFNILWGDAIGFDYSVYADVLYKRPFEVPLQRGLKPKKVNLKYLDTRRRADRFGKAYMVRQQQSCYKYDFSSTQMLMPGYCYTFHEDKALGVSSVIRILSATYDYDCRMYRYKAEGANAVATLPLEDFPQETGSLSSQILPKPQRDFFYVTVDRSLFLKEENDSFAIVEAAGTGVNLASSLDWYLRGSNLGIHEKALKLPVSELVLGSNNITCRIIIDSVPYERSVSLIKTKVSNNALMQYRYGSDSHHPPYTEGGIWFWGSKPIFHNGKIVGNINSENWIEGIPEKTEEAPYLWMRISTDGGNTWTYTRLHASDDISFDISSNVSMYPISARGATIAPTAIKMHAEKKNTLKECHWSSVPELFAPTVSDDITFSIPVGFRSTEITVRAEIQGLGVKEKIFTAYEVGSKEPLYVGDLYTLEQLEAMPISPSGVPWVTGDHALVCDYEDGKEVTVPYVYHEAVEQGASHWKMLETTDEQASLVMRNSLYDIVEHGHLKKSCAAAYGFFQHFAAFEAFIQSLRTYRIFMDPGDFHFEISGVDENGNLLQTPIFKISYRGKNLFSIDFSVDNPSVMIGDYNKDGGLIWDAKNNELKVNGSGSYAGLLKTPTIETVLSGEDTWIQDPDITTYLGLKRAILSASGDKSGVWIPISGVRNGAKLVQGMVEEEKSYHVQWTEQGGGGWNKWTIYGCGTVWNRSVYVKDENGKVYEHVERSVYVRQNGQSSSYPAYPTDAEKPAENQMTKEIWFHNGQHKKEPLYTEWNDTVSTGKPRTEWTDADNITEMGHWNKIREHLYLYNIPTEEPTQPNRVWSHYGTLMIS